MKGFIGIIFDWLVATLVVFVVLAVLKLMGAIGMAWVALLLFVPVGMAAIFAVMVVVVWYVCKIVDEVEDRRWNLK